MKLPKDMDKECIELCKAMNQMPGIRTYESCCGHGTRPYWIAFIAQNLKVLPRLLYYFDVCHCGYPYWRVYVSTDCSMRPAAFEVEGPIGKRAYQQSRAIAKLLIEESKRHRHRRIKDLL